MTWGNSEFLYIDDNFLDLKPAVYPGKIFFTVELLKSLMRLTARPDWAVGSTQRLLGGWFIDVGTCMPFLFFLSPSILFISSKTSVIKYLLPDSDYPFVP